MARIGLQIVYYSTSGQIIGSISPYTGETHGEVSLVRVRRDDSGKLYQNES